jgi:nucleotide-binding universal stress UspA family protein
MTATAPLAHRIVVGVDSSEPSQHALHWAARRPAEMTGGSLEAVTAWQWPLSLGRGMPLSLGYDSATDAAAVPDQGIDDVRRAHPGLLIHPKVVEGSPVTALIEASQGADIVVVGAGVHSQIARILRVPLSTHFLTSVHCPVVIVREDPHAPKSAALGDPTSRAGSLSTTGATV